eukprot:TRINITY_DN61415_c0_g1_i1.p1 TRINITY_DN61415_c0_g1~~TRINITY_DN61415_c0_g1_i1.p1  ORF type:complete len:564 (+),score=108.13 TRINITY_DN61415_c0_g1_i1:90-1781(+)
MEDRTDGSCEFKKLLAALSEQYDRDIAEASWSGGKQSARDKPDPMLNTMASLRSIASVESVNSSNGGRPHGNLPPCAGVQKAWEEQAAQPQDGVPEETGTTAGSTPELNVLNISDVDEEDEVHLAHKSARATTATNNPRAHMLEVGSEMRSNFARQGHSKRRPTRTYSRSLREPDRISRFVRSSTFGHVSASLLIANAVFIGVQTEVMFYGEPPLVVEIIDYLFSLLFLAELLLRFWGYGCAGFWCDRLDRAWNCFDFIVVGFSTVDAIISLSIRGTATPFANISVLRTIRITRITRVLRVFRVMKFFKDLRILLAAIVSTIKTAYFALILIFMIMYMFAVAITQMVAEHVVECESLGKPVDADLRFFFGSVPEALFAMFMTLAGGIDWKDAAVPLYTVSPIAIIFYVAFVILMTLIVLNVLTGIFCQCAIEASAQDKDNIILYQLQDRTRFMETLQGLFKEWDEEEKGFCTLEEFKKHLQDSSMTALLNSLDIEVHDALTLFEMLDQDRSGQVDLDEFITGCITLRGNAKAVQIEKIKSLMQSIMEEQGVLRGEIRKLQKET